jgi:sugar phosphate isomerase/epimerase
MSFKLSCADFTFPLLTHEKVMDVIAILDLDGMDIGLFQDRGHLQPDSEFEDIERNAKDLKRKLNERGLVPSDIFLQTALDFVSSALNHPELSVRDFSRDAFRKTLEYAAISGAKHVTILPGAFFVQESKADSFSRACEELSWRIEKATEYDLILSVEAHLGSVVPTPVDAMKLIESTPGLTLTLDYSHFAYQGIPDSDVEPLLKYASHFHARSAAENKVQTILSECSVDYKRVIHRLLEVGYDGFIGIEYNWTDWEGCNRTDNISETILMRELIKEAEKFFAGENK